ncbi:hypothetical protein [Legionella parisiensis]|uniref:Uncharacterized protein n=1 Tax=Legionella parisiensis TaxID=45071 RepID=A0A1E5JUK9_9GAMM|nr:hypothetical protein [Legionella parisiensis]KTD43167.1 hypothetical protein Lpar_1144 [Legionella parisiensis]OEH48234.1 hypothetical protein lpari_00726 [Legionella parisiensis]STX77752.1 Uncharacterised protein [Legionella parisiensis]
MGLSLSELLTYQDDGQITFDGAINGEKATSYQDYLLVLDAVTRICEHEDDAPLSKAHVKNLAKVLLQKFQEHLRETQSDWYDKSNPKIYTVAKQLESFAYLTGEQEAINLIFAEFPLLKLVKCDYESYLYDNFLNNDDPLKFKNFDRDLLVLQMMIRVLDPRYINQRNEQVCGVNAFVHHIALLNPLKYVQIVTELAAKGVCDLKEFAGKEGVLRVEVTEEVANKKSSDGATIHDADHVILNGIRSSENSIVHYSEEGADLAKKLFGVTSHHEINNWMKQAGYNHVYNISMHNRAAIKQLQLLIHDGYMVGFAGTGSLANYILYPEEGEPKGQNVMQRFMDGHFFIIRNIEFDEQNDKVNIRIMTWGKEQSASIPFDVWEKNIGLVGRAVVGQDPYMNIMFRAKVRDIDDLQRNTYCSPEAYCLYVKNIIEDSPGYEKINKLLDQAFKHEKGIAWLQAAKAIQDSIEELPKEKALMVPSKISIIPLVTPEIIKKFDEIHHIHSRTRKISALENLGAQDNIEVQRQLIPLYAQEGQWDKIKVFLADIERYSHTDREIIYESLELGCCLVFGEVKVPRDIEELIEQNTRFHFEAKELISVLSEITGLPKGGPFTYGLKSRLLEVVNHRLEEEGKAKVHNLSGVILYKKDIYNLVSLLDKEIHSIDPPHKIMSKAKLEEFCIVLIDKIKNKEDALQDEVDLQFASNLHYKLPKIFQKISEFFLKVASIFDKNLITNSIEKTKDLKEDLNGFKENNNSGEQDPGMTHS